METMDDFKDELEASFRQIREGDIITGTVIAVSEEEITLDLKYYAQGIIKVEDFSNDPDFAVLEQIHAGDEIEATVVKTDDGQGNILLSRKEANMGETAADDGRWNGCKSPHQRECSKWCGCIFRRHPCIYPGIPAGTRLCREYRGMDRKRSRSKSHYR